MSTYCYAGSSPDKNANWIIQHYLPSLVWVDDHTLTEESPSQIVEKTGYSYTSTLIPVDSSHEIFVYGGNIATGYSALFVEYDENKDFVDFWGPVGMDSYSGIVGEGRLHSLNANTKYIRICSTSGLRDKAFVYDQTDFAYLLANNKTFIQPLQCQLKWLKNNSFRTNGNIVQTKGEQCTETYVPVIGGHSITWFYGNSNRFQDSTNSTDIQKLIEYDENKSVVDYWNPSRNETHARTITLASTTRYIRLSAPASDDFNAYVYDETNQKYIVKDNMIV